MTTLALFVERIRRHLSGGFPSIHDRVGDAEIKYQAQAAINRLLKTEALSTNFSLDGGTIPDGVVIATYEDVDVTAGARHTIKLPVMPMYLPERMGVFAVVPYGADDEPGYDKEYIPIPPGQQRSLAAFGEVSPLLGEKSYTWEGGKLTLHGPYTEDDPAPEKVLLKLCVADLDNIEDDDPLPLSPDLEEAVMAAVVQFYTAQPTTPRDEGMEASPRKNDK